jgi:hypothetical protein
MKAIYFLLHDQTGLLRQLSFWVFFHAGQPPHPKMSIKHVYNTTMHSASEKILKNAHSPINTFLCLHVVLFMVFKCLLVELQQSSSLTRKFFHTHCLFHGQNRWKSNGYE